MIDKRLITHLITYMFIIIAVLPWNISMNSYIYLNDKQIKEEVQIGSFVADIRHELDSNKLFKNQLWSSQQPAELQFTLLDDSKISHGNAFFKLDFNTGVLTTQQSLDRENLCLTRQCADSCELGSSMHHSHNTQHLANSGSCRINLKILIMPSYNILNLNVYIEDTNDNRPFFPTPNITQLISENVPIGFKIPVDLAYDPDFGKNTVQNYEINYLASGNMDYANLLKSTFKLSQNLNDSQLYLVVISKLDRENISSYNLSINAYDGGAPTLSSSLTMLIQITDINDNNPVFESSIYKFSLVENTPIDSVIGRVRANDLDSGLNGKIKYRFVDSSISMNNENSPLQKSGIITNSYQSINKYFDLDENTGVIKLKSPIDYEDEKYFSLTIEARDLGIGSLPSYTNVDIEVVDLNDNRPEITVSFLSSLFKNVSQIDGFKYDIYLEENTKANKFISHVSISDRDSGDNGLIDWEVLINNKYPIYSSVAEKQAQINVNSILKLIKLNNNSFTLNIASSDLLDRELNSYFNICIVAWDYGKTQSYKTDYNFTIRLIDVNDNAPQFDRPIQDIRIYENNEPFEAFYRLSAHDSDSPGPNSNISYSIKEHSVQDYLYIDDIGNLRSKIRFDREKIDKLTFNVIASDHGHPSLFSSMLINLYILDLNDNSPIITFNSPYLHHIMAPKSAVSLPKNMDHIEHSYTLNMKINKNLPVNTKVIDFKCSDRDEGQQQLTEMVLQKNELNLFKLVSNGQLLLNKRFQQQQHLELLLICKDLPSKLSSPRQPSLNSSVKINLELVEKTEYCIKTSETVANKTARNRFINREQFAEHQSLLITSLSPISTARSQFDIKKPLFTADYVMMSSSVDELLFELSSHKELFQIHSYKLNSSLHSSSLQNHFKRLEIRFHQGLSYSNLSRLMLGKYTVKVSLIDKNNPSCKRQDLFGLLVGSNFITEKDITTFLKSIKDVKNTTASSASPIINKNNLNKVLDKFSNEKEEQDDQTDESSENENDYNLNDYVRSSKLSDRLPSDSSYSSPGSQELLYKVKPATLMKSDYVLLFILIIIIICTVVLFAFISIICIYNKYKKQYSNPNKTVSNKLNIVIKKKSNKSSKQNQHKQAISVDVDVDDACMNDTDVDANLHHLSANHTFLSKKNTLKSINEARTIKLVNKKSKGKQKKLLKSADLNTSSASTSSNSSGQCNDSSTSSSKDSSVKQKYELVTSNNSTNGSTSSSASTSSSCNAASNGTLLFRETDDDEFPVILASPGTALRQLPNFIREKQLIKEKQLQYHQNGQHLQQYQSRYMYSNTLASASRLNPNRNMGYESNRSNSAAESTTIDSTATIDDSKSNNSLHEYDGFANQTNPYHNLNNNHLHNHHHHHHQINPYQTNNRNYSNVNYTNTCKNMHKFNKFNNSIDPSIIYNNPQADNEHNTKKRSFIELNNIICSEPEEQVTFGNNIDKNICVLNSGAGFADSSGGDLLSFRKSNCTQNHHVRAELNTNNNTNHINNNVSSFNINPRCTTYNL